MYARFKKDITFKNQKDEDVIQEVIVFVADGAGPMTVDVGNEITSFKNIIEAQKFFDAVANLIRAANIGSVEAHRFFGSRL